ncbi:LacI family transcriptional regulator [Amycolatopsis sp. NBC_00345]|uniref:LacI family DNA-binding transcriptional regulator n=1 Tax=Amycolatopsis sp. NBC_00345 TaxID=2975955 RepID=UPI002E260944
MKRPTIMDVARRAGVAKGTVSYALNGQPGVSEETRRRILAVAEELGWRPNPAARALSGSGSQVIGMVLARPAMLLGVEPFLMRLTSGIELELARSGFALMLKVVGDLDEEMAIYRKWASERRVDGLLILDLRVRDPRLELVEQLGLPATVMGDPRRHAGLSVARKDETAAMTSVVEYLAALGHRRIVHVAGQREFLHIRQRGRAFGATLRRLGVTGTARTIYADYTLERAAEITRGLLAEASPPTALIYDNDVMAVAGAGVAREMGVDVPGGLSIVAWDDSPLCQFAYPPLTAVSVDVVEYGRAATELLISVIGGGPAGEVTAEPARLIPRGTTARAKDAPSRA